MGVVESPEKVIDFVSKRVGTLVKLAGICDIQ